jgi:hypothetical protein
VHLPQTFSHLEKHFTTNRPIMLATGFVANYTPNAANRNVHHLITQATNGKNKQTQKISTTDLFDDTVYIMMLTTDGAAMSVLLFRR